MRFAAASSAKDYEGIIKGGEALIASGKSDLRTVQSIAVADDSIKDYANAAFFNKGFI